MKTIRTTMSTNNLTDKTYLHVHIYSLYDCVHNFNGFDREQTYIKIFNKTLKKNKQLFKYLIMMYHQFYATENKMKPEVKFIITFGLATFPNISTFSILQKYKLYVQYIMFIKFPQHTHSDEGSMLRKTHFCLRNSFYFST